MVIFPAQAFNFVLQTHSAWEPAKVISNPLKMRPISLSRPPLENVMLRWQMPHMPAMEIGCVTQKRILAQGSPVIKVLAITIKKGAGVNHLINVMDSEFASAMGAVSEWQDQSRKAHGIS